MKFSWRVVALWSVLALVIGFFFWQGSFASTPADTGKNAANTRMTYGRFLEYLDADRVTSVDLYDGGRTAIIEANDQDIENRIQRWRVDLPVNAPELIQSSGKSKSVLMPIPCEMTGQSGEFCVI